MLSPSRVFRISFLGIILCLFISLSLFAQDLQDPTPSPQKQQLIKDRDRLLAKATTLARARKFAEGMAVMQEVLSIEKKIYGPSHANVLIRLEWLATRFELLENWKSARQALQEIADIQDKLYGKEGWQTQDAQRAIKDLEFRQRLTLQERQLLHQATQLNLQVLQLHQQGQSTSAIPLALKVMDIRQSTLGKKHTQYAISLINLAEVYHAQGEFIKALPLLKEARTVYKEVLGEKHPQYAISLNNLAGLYVSQGEYGKALALHMQAMELRKEVLGEKHSDYANSLNNIALIYSTQGEVEKALPLLKKASVIYKEVFGEKHPNYTTCLNNLAMLYEAQGDYGTALPLYQRAMTLIKEVLGEKNPQYAFSLVGLATLYLSQGEYGKALPLYQQALSLRQEVLGPQHPDYAFSLSLLARLYAAQKEYHKALPLYQQALTIRLQVLGKRHPDYASSLSALAGVYSFLGEYDKAIPLLNQAREIYKDVFGEKHPNYADLLNHFAWLYYSQGEFEKALQQSQKVSAIYKDIFGEKHPFYVTSLNNLAGMYEAQREYENALTLYQQAMALQEEALGKLHPQYALSLNNMAGVYYHKKDFKKAVKYLLKGANVSLKVRLQVAQEGFQRAAHTSEHLHLAILAGLLARKGEVTEAWDWLEQSLGRATFDEVTAKDNRTQEEQVRLEQLQGSIQQTEQRLKKLTALPKLSEDQKKIQNRMLDQQRRHYSQLAKLYAQLEEKYGITEGKSYSLKQIQSALSDDTAFLTWIDALQEHWAVLVRSTGKPIFVSMKANNQAWAKEDLTLPTTLYSKLQTHRNNFTEIKPLLEKLRKQRIEPLSEYLNGIEHVIVLPSALMDKIPMDLLLPTKKVSRAPSATMYAYLQQQEKAKGNRLLALGDPIFDPQAEFKEKPLPDSGILITSVVVNSMADKAGLKVEHVLLKYAGMDLNTVDDLQKAMASVQGKKEVRIKVWNEGKEFEKVIPTGRLGVVLARQPAKIALQNRRKQHWQIVSRGDNWIPLPGTRIEVNTIAKLMDENQREILFDSVASEQQLHQLASTDKLKEFKYLHFATHGDVNHYLPMESALILSRDKLKANVTELKPNEPYLDGRLTAKEVALHWTLDADLVTLSACNSGLGKHATGEGYMGFSQSFLIRGARSVVLSLWSVDDTATALLMSRFYENLIKNSMSKIDALQEAKNWLQTLPRSKVEKLIAGMTQGVVRSHRGKGFKVPLLKEVPMTEKKDDAPYAHPYYWSAFILIGDPK